MQRCNHHHHHHQLVKDLDTFCIANLSHFNFLCIKKYVQNKVDVQDTAMQKEREKDALTLFFDDVFFYINNFTFKAIPLTIYCLYKVLIL